jgi:hypothetical protein
MTVLSLSAEAPAFAFQEISVPPAAPGEPPPPALAIGNPAIPAEAPEHDEMEVFGYAMPKLDFGLELLYGEEQQLELQGPPPPTLEGDSDISVLGKIKRRF